MADAELFSELPDGWQVKRLADLASLQSGGTPSKQRPDFWLGPIPWASPKDMKQPYLFDAEDHISEDGLADGSRRVPAGSLFIVVRGMILDRDIPIAMAMVPMAFNQDMKAIVPNGQVDGDFLLFALRQFREQLRAEVGSSAHGTKRIGTSAIEGFRVPLPPLPEQRAIAAVLRAVQRAREAAEAVASAARQLKRSLLRHLFTYGPVPVDHADRVPLQETDIGSIPEHWALKPLGQVAELFSGGTPSKQRPDFWTGTIPWASPKDLKRPRLFDVTDHVTPEAVEKGSRLAPAGSIFVVVRGMILLNDIPLSMAMVPMAFNQDMKALVAGKDVSPDFLLYALNATKGTLFREISSAAHGTKRISTSALEAMKLPLPPPEEQNQIGTALRAAEDKIEAEESRVSALGELFRSLLRDLMTGRVRVHELGIA